MAFSFEHVKEFVHKHPVATGAIVIGGGLGILFLLSMFGGGSSAAPASGGMSPAEAQLRAAQIAAGVQNNATDAQVRAAQIAAQAQTSQNASNNSVAARVAQIQASMQMALAKTAAALQTTLSGNQLQLGTLQTTTAADVYKELFYAKAQEVSNAQDYLQQQYWNSGDPTGMLGQEIAALTGMYAGH